MTHQPTPNTQYLTPMKILVTGCAGFIGWKVCEFLLDDGHTVTGIDTLDDAYDARLKQWRLRQLEARQNFRFHRLDVRDGKTLAQLFHSPFETTRPKHEAVINLAARAGVRQSLEDPWAYYETNVTGTLNLLELCREFGVPKFVLASTSSVYGEAARPFREEVATDRPLSPYAASKKAAEALCYTYHHLCGLDVTIFRYFTVYGPAGRPDMSIFRFVRWMVENEPLILYGDGTQERDFTYVDDIARGTVLGLKPLGYEIINLGSDRPVPLKTIVGLLEDLLGQPARLHPHPMHPADVPATWADISRARRLLGWEPRTTVEEGLHNVVKWYQENRQWVREIRVL
jgi:UDP-glucuronate 4-epimerase